MDNFFYNSSIKSYIVAFGNIFNNIKVLHGNGKERTVRIKYASKEKFIDKTFDNNTNPEVETILPAMSYEMVDLSYDSTRKTNTLHKNTKLVDGVYQSQLNPTPWNLDFTLSIYARYGDEMLQIVEQILPFFQPSFNITIKENPVMGITERDIPILLTGVSPSTEYEGDTTRRRIEWSLNFTLKGWLYPPIKEENSVIKRVLVDFGIKGASDNTIFEGSEFIIDPFTSGEDDSVNLVRAFTFLDEFNGHNLELGPMWEPNNENALPIIKNNSACTRDNGINSAYWTGYNGKDVYIEATLELAVKANVVLSASLKVRADVDTLEGLNLHIYSDGSSEVKYREPDTNISHLIETIPAGTFATNDLVKLQIEDNEDDIIFSVYKNNIEILSDTLNYTPNGNKIGFSVGSNGCVNDIRLGNISSSTYYEQGKDITGRAFTDGFSEGFN